MLNLQLADEYKSNSLDLVIEAQLTHRSPLLPPSMAAAAVGFLGDHQAGLLLFGILFVRFFVLGGWGGGGVGGRGLGVGGGLSVWVGG